MTVETTLRGGLHRVALGVLMRQANKLGRLR